jgi:peptide/nickel transport system permease protein
VTAPPTVRIGSFAMPGSRWWREDTILAIALIVCSLLVLIAAFGPAVAPFDPDDTDILNSSSGPTASHLLGTDSLGRDILSRILHGARLSFLGPLIIVVISTTLGTVIALGAAWKGGMFEQAVDKVLSVMFAVPGILVAVIAVASFGAGFWAPVLALALVYIPYVARVVKSAALQERRRAYVEAFQLAGISAFRISVRHILRNVQPIILAQATINFGSSLIEFGALSFLGLGIPAPAPEWGAMVSAGRSELLSGHVEQTLAAGTMIVITVVAFNLLGDRISRRLGVSR